MCGSQDPYPKLNSRGDSTELGEETPMPNGQQAPGGVMNVKNVIFSDFVMSAPHSGGLNRVWGRGSLYLWAPHKGVASRPFGGERTIAHLGGEELSEHPFCSILQYSAILNQFRPLCAGGENCCLLSFPGGASKTTHGGVLAKPPQGR